MRKRYISDLYYDDCILEFFEGYETFCFQNCMRLLLGGEGIKNAELYINASINVQSRVVNGEIEIYTSNETRGLLPSIENAYKRIYCNEVDSTTILKENLLYIEQNQKPIIIGVDTFYLPYASNYQRNHAIHTALLAGYDLDKEIVYIIDWYAPWFFKGEVSFEDCIAARTSQNPSDGSIFSGVSIRNNYTIMKEILAVDERKLILEMLECSKDNYVKYRNNNEAVGAEAYIHLKSYINENCEKVDMNKLSQQILLVSKRYAFFRQYIILARDFLKNLIEGIEDDCNKIIEELDIIHFVLLKMDYVKNEKNINKFNNHIDKVVALHQEIQEKIINICKSIK